uniref:WWE domain-containing protein n=1 Tax=Oryzias latipes TaxID=8090 RepID=A0A3P9M967_ORYLA
MEISEFRDSASCLMTKKKKWAGISGMTTCGGPGASISSKDIEHHFTLYPQGSLRFTVGSNGYSMDFSTMTQKNLVTGLQRNIRRRPKFPSNTAGLYTTTVLAGPPQLSAPGSKWEFMGDQGQWTEYQAHVRMYTFSLILFFMFYHSPGLQGQDCLTIYFFFSNISPFMLRSKVVARRFSQFVFLFAFVQICSCDSSDIEREYNIETLIFFFNICTKSCVFVAMTQRNLSTNTGRAGRRTQQ